MTTNYSTWTYEKLWEQELREGKALNLKQLEARMEELVDERTSEVIAEEIPELYDLLEEEIISLDDLSPRFREQAIDQVVFELNMDLGSEDLNLEDAWFAYLAELREWYEEHLEEGDIDRKPWEEPKRSAAQEFAYTVEFDTFFGSGYWAR